MHACLGQPPPDQPCRLCTHYGGIAWDDPSCIWCVRDGRRCVSQPDRGCAFYLRLTGVDDDWQPPAAPEGWRPIRPPAPAPRPVQHRSTSSRVPLEA